MTAATARAPWVPAQKDAGQACDDSVVAGLVACAKGGDQQARDAPVERYAPLIWSICRRYRLGHADAGDVSQSVWMCLVDQLDKIRDPAALPGWLATTTRRECWRVVGAARGPNAAVCALGAETIPDGQAEAVEQELLAAERRAALREAFTHLPPEGQQLIAMLVADPPGAVRRDQRQAGHTHRQHRPDPQSLPGQDAPLPGHRGADPRRVRLGPASHGRGQLNTATALPGDARRSGSRIVLVIPVTKTTPDHSPYSKRAMAGDCVALMRALGHQRFCAAGLPLARAGRASAVWLLARR